MDQERTLELLRGVRDGSVSMEEALFQLRQEPFEDLGYAKVDHHRGLRQGAGEVIYGAGKTVEQIVGITRNILQRDGSNILVTRVGREVYDALVALDPTAVFHEMARIVVARPQERPLNPGYVAVVTGGTSDMPVAEEAAVTAETLGNRVERIYDVGVAGIHRLLAQRERLMGANVLVVAAGMEGALASAVGGLVDRPIIAVPTSVGYGANFGGMAALLAMLNSCASGVSVVNIDNGFGAGYLAAMINRPGHQPQR